MPTLTREALYERVWANPMRMLAVEFGVSDAWLKKLCTAARVPAPDRGYWAKLRAGKPVIRLKLPQRGPGEAEAVTIGGPSHGWTWDPEAELKDELPAPPVYPEPLADVQARVERGLGKVVRSRDLANPAVPVRKLLEEDERRRQKQAQSPYPSSFGNPLFESPFEHRRLRVINALALALAKQGYRLTTEGKAARDLQVVVGSQRVSFQLDHPAAKPDHWGQWSARPGPADRLKLQLKPRFGEGILRRVWEDAAPTKLEDLLSEIAVALIVAGEAEYRNGQLAHHAYLVKRRADNEAEVEKRRGETERLARETRAAEAKARRELLFAQAAAWRSARDIRGFVDDVLATPGSSPPEDLARWAQWARDEADLIDPRRQVTLAPPPSAA